MTSDGHGINISGSSWKQLNVALLLLLTVFISAPVIVF